MSRRKPKPAYPPRYFTELMRRHNWPPGFVSRTGDDTRTVAAADANRAMRETDARAVAGIGWGTGTIPLPRTPGNKRPAWMVRPKMASK